MNKNIAIFILIASVLFSSCANIVPPTGGPRDTTPPKLRSITPADSQTNVRPKKITLIFDKYMELDNVNEKMTISPLLARKPTVLNYGKKIVISIEDSLLLPNTTYTLSLGDALKDNREGTPFPNFTYRFSTGDYFDSLSIKGKVINAHTGQADTGSTILLYDASTFTDSAVFKQTPLYISRTKSDGSFIITGLPAKSFRIFALSSKEKALQYVPGQDWFAFIDKVIHPLTDKDSSITLQLFKEDKVVEEYTDATQNRRQSFRSSSISLTEKEPYKVVIDTMSTKVATQELNKPLLIITRASLGKVNQDKVFLSFEKEGVELQASYQYEKKDTVIHINTRWQSNAVYTLRLVKGWATDTSGNELTPSKYVFRTQKEESYGTMSLKFGDSFIKNDYLLQLNLNADSIALLPITDSVLLFTMLKPGNYQASLIKDWNRDGLFTTGDYILGRQPEPIIVRTSPLVIKAGWTHEYDFAEQKPPAKPSMRNPE